MLLLTSTNARRSTSQERMATREDSLLLHLFARVSLLPRSSNRIPAAAPIHFAYMPDEQYDETDELMAAFGRLIRRG